nr:SGNH/GDSL hydrolase family protein [Agromyces seonyuensis]
MRGRGWDRLVDELVEHYADAIELARAGDARFLTAVGGIPEPQPAGLRPDRFVAVGDSLTEGLDDTSRQADGQYRGWADRLAMLLALSRGAAGDSAGQDAPPLRYANLAVRSRRVRDVVDEQIPAAIGLGADLVAVLVGGNDLVKWRARPDALAARLDTGIARLRDAGVEVLLVTAFTPPNPLVARLQPRFARFNRALAQIAERRGCRLLDFGAHREFLDERVWSPDRVHLGSRGHRLLAYRAAAVLGVPDAAALAALDDALHDGDGDDPLPTREWVRRHAAPWAWRRLRGRTAGDGMSAKHDRLIELRPGDGARAPHETT